MKLNELFNIPGARRTKKRVGRGIGSGKGKTCGSGTKGQKARSGVAINGFEGGQMPLIARLPKRGFNCPSSKNFIAFNFKKLQEITVAHKVKPGTLIDKDFLVKAGFIKNPKLLVKLLGDGALSEKFDFKLDAYSKTAKDAVEKVGGKIL